VDSSEPLHLVIPATLLDARAATERVVTLCGRFDLEDRARYGTAVMEWLVNVVKHSYVHAPGVHITINVVAGPESIELKIEDTGVGMAPGQFEAAASEVIFDQDDLSGLPEHGMGLAIIKSVMDSVHYQRERGVNRLTAVKRWVR
jgi:anti-sigma regulatory factor (Ser/Thr protein kinase)